MYNFMRRTPSSDHLAGTNVHTSPVMQVSGRNKPRGPTVPSSAARNGINSPRQWSLIRWRSTKTTHIEQILTKLPRLLSFRDLDGVRAYCSSLADNSDTGLPTSISEGGTATKLDLDSVPQLSWPQELACLAVAFALCSVFYYFTAPASLSLKYGAAIASLCAVILTVARNWLLEELHKAQQRAVTELGDLDSKFLSISDLAVHTKTCHPTASSPGQAGAAATPQAGLHCYHGFGANLYSWSLVQSLLADRLKALVTAHDMPGFGLTERPRELSGYFLSFNGRLGRKVLQHELLSPPATPTPDSPASPSQGAAGQWGSGQPTSPTASQDTVQAMGALLQGVSQPATLAAGPVPQVLVGHSMGGACAALEALEHPDSLAALVLVAPAIFAPLGNGSGARYSDMRLVPRDKAAQTGPVTELVTVGMPAPPPQADANKIAALLSTVTGLLKWCAVCCVLALLRLSSPLLVLLLRGAVRSRTFWQRGLQQAYHNPQLVTDKLVDSYRLPKMVLGWESGLVNFLLARLSAVPPAAAMKLMRWQWWRAVAAPGSASEEAAAEQAESEAAGGDLAGDLASLVAARKLPVLIIHGRQDRLVPVGNSLRLARCLAGARLVLMDGCGHMPQEELPQTFVDIVEDFLASALPAAK